MLCFDTSPEAAHDDRSREEGLGARSATTLSAVAAAVELSGDD